MKNKVSKDGLKEYLDEAKGWETDKVKELKKSKKIAWWIAAVAICMAFLSTIAVFDANTSQNS